MISNTHVRNQQAEKRIKLRDRASILSNVIEKGSNCSLFEAELITEKALEVFRLGDYSFDTSKPLEPGQMIWQAISATEPPGKPLGKCEYKRIVLTPHRLEEDREVKLKHGNSSKRGQQILRMTREAESQGTLLTVEDLGVILDCDEKTIRTDIKHLKNAYEVDVPTRGNKCDIGPGGIFVFVIPVAFNILKKEDRPYLAKGILIGIISIPVGCFIGGLTAGYSLEMIIRNLIPIIAFSALIAIGLWKVPNKMISIFIIFGKFIVVFITLSLALIVAQSLSGIVFIKNMMPIEDALITIGLIAITLAGAFPLVHFISTVFKKPLLKLGKLIGVNDVAATGMIASLANAIPMYGMIKDMDENGKVLSFAFSISAGFIFGDHLGFTAAMDGSMIFPVMVGKISGGIFAILIGKIFFLKKTNQL